MKRAAIDLRIMAQRLEVTLDCHELDDWMRENIVCVRDYLRSQAEQIERLSDAEIGGAAGSGAL